MAVAGVFPAVARDLIGAPDSACRQHDGFRAENKEPSPLAVVTKSTHDAVALFEQRKNRPLHVNIDSLMNTVVLQRPDHLQTGSVADMSQPRITVAAEISLQDAPVLRAIENGAPRFEFAHA